MNKVPQSVLRDLNKKVDKKYKEGISRFFAYEVDFIGVRTGNTRAIGKKYFREIKDENKEEIFKLAEELLDTKIMEPSLVGVSWAYQMRNQCTQDDFLRFEKWVKKYVTNWALCDDLGTHVLHHFVATYPKLIPQVKKWTKSKNRWYRRSAAVSFLSYKSEPEFHTKENMKHIFDIATRLLEDEDDLVQKGYGWMLKVAADTHQKEVFDFVMKNKKKMPRTALRYAIEKMPANLKKQAMS